MPAYAALLAELATFNDGDTRKLIGLMYSGREQVSLRAMHISLGHNEPEHDRSQIFSKRGVALPNYLRWALERARATGIDLDAPLPDRELLRALWVAGVSDSTLDRWDPSFLSLRKVSGGISADARSAEWQARENSARGDYVLDLGHESLKLAREKGAVLEQYLTENEIPLERKGLGPSRSGSLPRPRE